MLSDEVGKEFGSFDGYGLEGRLEVPLCVLGCFYMWGQVGNIPPEPERLILGGVLYGPVCSPAMELAWCVPFDRRVLLAGIRMALKRTCPNECQSGKASQALFSL